MKSGENEIYFTNIAEIYFTNIAPELSANFLKSASAGWPGYGT